MALLSSLRRSPFIPAFTFVALLALSQIADLAAQGPSFTFSTLAGRPTRGSSDGSGSAAAFNGPQGIAVTSNGAIYIADTAAHTIRRIGTDGVVATVAGVSGLAGVTNGFGSSARFNSPRGVAVDAVGAVYVAENNGYIRRIAQDGAVTTLIQFGFNGQPLRGIVADGSGNLYVTSLYAVWRVNISTATATILAGSVNTAGYVDGAGTDTRFNQAAGLTIDGSGNLYVTDTVNQRIRKITQAGVSSTVAVMPAAADNSAGAYGLAIDGNGVLFAANTVTHEILRITQAGVVTVFAGTNGTAGSVDGTGTAARFSSPMALGHNSAGVLYVADTGNSTIRAVSTAGAVTTYAGLAGGAGNVDGVGTVARFNSPRGIAVGQGGTVYVADYENCTIRAITPGGTTSTFAGTVGSQAAACGSTNGTGTAAKFAFPSGVVADSAGNVFVADTTNNVIRKITSAGVVTTFAGFVGSQGSTDGTGSAARFSVPQGLAVDAQDNIYVADLGNHIIRMITPAGVVTTVAGGAGQTGSTDATGTAARFSSPAGVAVDTSGNIYVADTGNHRIRKIATGGVVTTLAGSFQSYTDATGTSARFNAPTGVATDSGGNVYVADRGNNLIRRVTPLGVTTTVTAQNTVADYTDGIAAGARFTAPYALAFDAAGNLYVSDGGNHAIRVGLISPAAPAFTTQPTSTSVNTGANATFTVAVTGNLTPTIRWQVSTNSGTSWTDLSDTAPYSGTTTTTLTITSVTSSLTTYRYRAVATNQSGSTSSDAATLTVNFISASPTALRFGARKAGASGAITAVTPPQTVTVIFSGTSTTWTAVSNQTWAVVSSGSGNGNGQFTVSIANPSNVIAGSTSLSATITITPGSGSLTAVAVPVTLTVDQTGTSTQPPVGQVDTPLQNATGIVGAIAVTGWVIDDIGISSVKVYRNCLPTEPQVNCQTGIVDGTSVVFVGDGSVVAGARPDVEAGFPTYAATNTAGWGIQVLTNMLPRTQGAYVANGGQGPVSFYVVATDIEGNRTLLSRAYTDTVRVPTSITMDNDAIAKPFGTIDTPAEGSTVSGSVANFGWALTPDSNTTGGEGGDILIPTNGSTMFVFIDGVPVAPIAYNQCRGNVGNPPAAGVFCNDDISNIFGNPTPQPTLTTRTANATRHRNLDAARGAIGAYVINTTTMTSGLHTLAWSVTDSAGRVEGIGSRYFSVLNSADAPLDAAQAVRSRGAASRLDSLWVSSEAIVGRSGFDVTAPYLPIAADDDGVRRVTINETGRLELSLGAVREGFLSANGTLRDLPVGSHLNVDTGVFTWAPGPGYIGTYRLAFVTNNEQILVDVTIRTPEPTRAGESEIRMQLDEVSNCPTASLPNCLIVKGEAFDPQAFTGSGIGAVHVWARRLDVPNSPAEFVGDATLDGRNFTLKASVPGGLYEVTAYAWNWRTGRWEDARSVVVHVR